VSAPMPNRKRIVLTKLGLDGHDRALRLLVRAVRDAGQEVIMVGVGATVDMVVATAVQEDADLIGVSMLSGAHLTLVPELIVALRAARAGDIPVILGGTIPIAHVPRLLEAGVVEVLGTGMPLAVCVERILYWANDRHEVASTAG
jgi:methylmalonyl-CoA mutase C-terminal domain/subunit